MQNRDRLTGGAQFVVRLTWIANRIFLLGVTLGLLASWGFRAEFAGLVGDWLPGADVQSVMTGMRLLMLLGFAMAVVTDRLLTTLSDIIATARAGDPFIAANADRLQRIGLCLLALQLSEIPGILIARNFPDMGSAAPNGDISIGGWIAVLMVFVLARVFAAGSAMRDDLEGTI